MAKGKGLGRGLDALIPMEEDTFAKTPVGIRISDIEPNPRQPRQDFDPEKLEELAQSIRENGVITPLPCGKPEILIRSLPENAAGEPAGWPDCMRFPPLCWR